MGEPGRTGHSCRFCPDHVSGRPANAAVPPGSPAEVRSGTSVAHGTSGAARRSASRGFHPLAGVSDEIRRCFTRGRPHVQAVRTLRRFRDSSGMGNSGGTGRTSVCKVPSTAAISPDEQQAQRPRAGPLPPVPCADLLPTLAGAQMRRESGLHEVTCKVPANLHNPGDSQGHGLRARTAHQHTPSSRTADRDGPGA